MLDGDNRIRIIIAGLILAAIAVGYMIFSQRFSSNNSGQTTKNTEKVQQITPTPTVTSVPNSTKGGLADSDISTLPKTGFPMGLAIVFSASTIMIGWGLRKYPN